MEWLNKQVSFYRTHEDNTGRPATYREILLSAFGSNIKEIIALRQLDINDPGYKANAKKLKAKLQCFTPAALLKSKAERNVIEIERTGIMQLDFDYKGIKDYDIDELKQAVFELPFICFCGLSCSGTGFYALALIAEPDLLSEYAEHCFEIFKSYGIQPDEGKGKKVENLRYISYDPNMFGIIERKRLEPLKISRFRRKEQPKNNYEYKASCISVKSNQGLVNRFLSKAQPGNRMYTIQQFTYALGGKGKLDELQEIKTVIENNNLFADQRNDFLKCADDCFRAGSLKPF